MNPVFFRNRAHAGGEDGLFPFPVFEEVTRSVGIDD